MLLVLLILLWILDHYVPSVFGGRPGTISRASLHHTGVVRDPWPGDHIRMVIAHAARTSALAMQNTNALEALRQADAAVEQIETLLRTGCTAEQIRVHYNVSVTELLKLLRAKQKKIYKVVQLQFRTAQQPPMASSMASSMAPTTQQAPMASSSRKSPTAAQMASSDRQLPIEHTSQAVEPGETAELPPMREPRVKKRARSRPVPDGTTTQRNESKQSDRGSDSNEGAIGVDMKNSRSPSAQKSPSSPRMHHSAHESNTTESSSRPP